MLVAYNKKNVLNAFIPVSDKKDAPKTKGIVIMPGVNEFANKVWEHVSKLPMVIKLVKSGEIAIKSKVEGDDDMVAIAKVENVDEAKDIVRQTFNHQLLKEWKDGETRNGVIKAINQQIAEIMKRTTKKKNEED